MKKIIIYMICAFLIICTISPLFNTSFVANCQETGNMKDALNTNGGISYFEYKEKIGETYSAEEDILVFEGNKICKTKSNFSNNVKITQTGWYNIEITYQTTDKEANNINFGILIDGKYPFNESKQFELSRQYKDAGNIRTDGLGNEFTAVQQEIYDVQTVRLTNNTSFTVEPISFYFLSGEHTITFENFTAEVNFLNIRLVVAEETDDYKKVSAEYEKLKKYDGEEILIEGEHAVFKSSSDLVAKSDNSSAAVYPNNPYVQKVNYIGSNWSKTGEEIVWQIKVPQDGLYKLSVHYRQNYILNGNSYRNIKIDGRTLFKETQMMDFPYKNSWSIKTFADKEGTPYLFYLEKGEHLLSMSVTLGPLSEFCKRLEKAVYELGLWYRQIVMITGETPDNNRDYDLFTQIPDLEKGLTSLYEEFKSLEEYYTELTGERGGTVVSTLNSMNNAIKSMLKYKYKAQKYKSNYYSNYSSVSAALYELMDMPLDIDTIILSSPDKELEKGEIPIFKKASYSFQRFLASFTVDYNNISGISEKNENIVLWINWGRDQAQALNALIQSDFVPEQKIGVKVKMTNASLVQGILSGNAPDCVLQHGRSEPVNLAMRDAAYNLKTFSDYESVIKRFADGAITPYIYKDGVYALPDTQSFMMLFIRTDIFDEMNLPIPETWNEFISVMKILSGNNLETGIATGFNLFLAQFGGDLYNEELTATDLLTTEAIDAFEFYTSLFTKYGCPKSYNFYNRFRTGLMPMGIQDYTMYSTLKATAPEINERWTMVPVPGFEQGNGTINNFSTGLGTACMILKDTESPTDAWEFLKWWTDTDTQLSYTQSIESVLGIAGRIATSNIEAASKLSWDGDCFVNLKKQWEQVKEFNEIPGSYYITRVLDQAYWNVVENGENPKDMLYRWSDVADKEIAKKIKQYEK